MPKMPSVPDMSSLIPDVPQMFEIKSASESAYEALVSQMRRFQGRLSNEMELGIVANGAGLMIHVESVRCAGQMIVFNGVDATGHQSQLIQHFTQMNVQMVAVPKLQEEPRRIGF